ncbi:ATP-dependent DNA helicase RecG [Crossiella equi]|uniref:ATP-dependent DNA helicase RecG n=1 Tax=Crossiella equi TaxID=130796 RepID=A0ABS5AK04_9PSEU|nr:ATP-binding protein [Crossiella equi]MBP2476895.1 ATP-dependent DNA helicase RecG [Crossiella equi]
MSEDLAELLGTKETTSLEFKESSKDRDKLAKAVCAFANDLAGTGGGSLLIGVDDKGDPVPGVDTSDQALRALTDLFRDSGLILDRPSVIVEVASFKGSPIVQVRVEPSSTPPVRFKGVAWVRPGPTTRAAGREDERVLSERRRALDGPYDTRPVHTATTDDLDLSLFRSDYLPSMVAPEIIAENHRPIEAQLASLRMATSDQVPTVLGLLVVGVDPGAHIPGAYLQFVRYQGTDLDAAVSDEQELRSNVVGSATRLAAVLRGHLHTRLTEEDDFREHSRPDYPFEALREVCMNAVMHRNYESSYAPVRVVWFDDRIEVTNPGGPYGQVNRDNYARVNDYRNPSLAAAMKALGYVNRFGRGIGRIQTALERNGNPPAEFTVDDSSWTVVLRKAP